MNRNITPEVEEISKMDFSGNLIPNSWFEGIRAPSGKPYLLACVILSEVVYWYRWTEIRDEQTGKTKGFKKKFDGNVLQKSYSQLAAKFGVSEKQVRDAVVALENLGLLSRRPLTVEKGGVLMNNVMHLSIHPDRIKELTY